MQSYIQWVDKCIVQRRRNDINYCIKRGLVNRCDTQHLKYMTVVRYIVNAAIELQ